MSICSPDILFDPEIFPYSESLINLLCACLKADPGTRPEINQIVRKAQQRVDYYDRQNAANNVPTDPNSLWSGTEPNVTTLHKWPMPQIMDISTDRFKDRDFIGVHPLEAYIPGPPAPDAPPFFFRDTYRPANTKLAEYPFRPLYDAHGHQGPTGPPLAPGPPPMGPEQKAKVDAAIRDFSAKLPAAGSRRFGDWWDEVQSVLYFRDKDVPADYAMAMFVARAPARLRDALYRNRPATLVDATQLCREEEARLDSI